ncbi:GNAT family N-acetyltransferase [Paraburkholderia aspalathi]|nr:GNAT family N-acetyltransferase [Paraburkholderia aspalathi]
MGNSVSAHIFDRLERAFAIWPAPDSNSVAGVPQSREWIAAWQRHVNQDCLIAALLCDDRPLVLLPLEIIRSGATTIARFAGGSHANGNFPVLSTTDDHPITLEHIKMLIEVLKKARPDIDALALLRQQATLSGRKNPLLQLGSHVNPNPVLSTRIEPDFDAVLARHSAKRKKKKHRSHARSYADAGGWTIITAETPEQAKRLLDAFFTMKARQFRQAGIADPFAPAGIHGFFNEIFGSAAHQADKRFEIKALEVGGQLRSVIGKIISGRTQCVEFCSISQDELDNTSPGEFLFYEDMALSCQQNAEIYSFGIGDEPYKRHWCDIEEPAFDTVYGLTLNGKIYTQLFRLRMHVTRRVKHNPRLWALAKTIRAKLKR